MLFTSIVFEIGYSCIHCRSFIALRHERWFALWLLDEPGQDFVKASLAEHLLHGRDSEQFLLIRIKASFCDGCGDGSIIDVAPVGATFNELEA